jgi:hypothetical protein
LLTRCVHSDGSGDAQEESGCGQELLLSRAAGPCRRLRYHQSRTTIRDQRFSLHFTGVPCGPSTEDTRNEALALGESIFFTTLNIFVAACSDSRKAMSPRSTRVRLFAAVGGAGGGTSGVPLHPRHRWWGECFARDCLGRAATRRLARRQDRGALRVCLMVQSSQNLSLAPWRR